MIQDAFFNKSEYFHVKGTSQGVQFHRMARHALYAHIDKGRGGEHLGNMAERFWLTTPDVIILGNHELDGNARLSGDLWQARAPGLCLREFYHSGGYVAFRVILSLFFWIGPCRPVHG